MTTARMIKMVKIDVEQTGIREIVAAARVPTRVPISDPCISGIARTRATYAHAGVAFKRVQI